MFYRVLSPTNRLTVYICVHWVGKVGMVTVIGKEKKIKQCKIISPNLRLEVQMGVTRDLRFVSNHYIFPKIYW